MVDVDYSAVSDHDLSEMLKSYGVDVGPVNMATRKIYEKKLYKLKTGQSMAAPPKYQPVVDDEEDDVVQFKPAPVIREERQQPQVPKVIHRTPEVTQPRQRREMVDTYSSHIDSRPSLSSARKTTLPYETRKPALSPVPRSEVRQSNTGTSSGGVPVWVKLVAVAVALVLIYLIYSNMESNAATSIPKIPNKMEV